MKDSMNHKLSQLAKRLQEIDKKSKKAAEEHNGYLRELGLREV